MAIVPCLPHRQGRSIKSVHVASSYLLLPPYRTDIISSYSCLHWVYKIYPYLSFFSHQRPMYPCHPPFPRQMPPCIGARHIMEFLNRQTHESPRNVLQLSTHALKRTQPCLCDEFIYTVPFMGSSKDWSPLPEKESETNLYRSLHPLQQILCLHVSLCTC